MSFKDKIKKLKGQLKDRHNEEQTRKSPSRFGSIFKEKLPDGTKFWKCGPEQHELDVVPFIADKDHPHVAEGDIAYSMDLYVHRNIGPSNESFICPRDNFKQPCPICEYIDDKKPPTEEWKQIACKDRTVYLVWCHDDNKQEKVGVQVWEVAKFFMADHLKELSKATPRGGGAVIWSVHTKAGKSIVFTRKGAGEYTKYFGHKFVDRKEDIPDWVLDQSFSLDTIINMRPSYNEIHEAFYGQAKLDDGGEELKPATGNDCPEGGEIGKDWKKFDECPDCALWDDCQDEADKVVVGESSTESSEEISKTSPETSSSEKSEPDKTEPEKKSRRSRRKNRKK